MDRLLARPDLAPELRARLELVGEVLDFARELGLEVGERYRSYAEWPGDRIVTAVVATRPGEVEPAGYSYPLLGRLPYRGYFDPELARAEAERLRSRGFDVCVSAVPAYSTLGWFDDPLTGPMLRRPPAELVETVLHELVHATVFVAGDARLSEGFATFVGQEGARRFARARGDARLLAAIEARIARSRALAGLRSRLREAVAELYRSLPPGPDRAARRRALEQAAREELAGRMLPDADPAELARRVPLNDACLALAGTYAGDLPRWQERLDSLGGDLRELLTSFRRAAEEDRAREFLLGEPPGLPRARR